MLANIPSRKNGNQRERNGSSAESSERTQRTGGCPAKHCRNQYIRAWQGLAERNRLGKGLRRQQSCRIHKVGVHAGERSHEAADRDQRKQHEVEE